MWNVLGSLRCGGRAHALLTRWEKTSLFILWLFHSSNEKICRLAALSQCTKMTVATTELWGNLEYHQRGLASLRVTTPWMDHLIDQSLETQNTYAKAGKVRNSFTLCWIYTRTKYQMFKSKQDQYFWFIHVPQAPRRPCKALLLKLSLLTILIFCSLWNFLHWLFKKYFIKMLILITESFGPLNRAPEVILPHLFYPTPGSS